MSPKIQTHLNDQKVILTEQVKKDLDYDNLVKAQTSLNNFNESIRKKISAVAGLEIPNSEVKEMSIETLMSKATDSINKKISDAKTSTDETTKTELGALQLKHAEALTQLDTITAKMEETITLKEQEKLEGINAVRSDLLIEKELSGIKWMVDKEEAIKVFKNTVTGSIKSQAKIDPETGAITRADGKPFILADNKTVLNNLSDLVKLEVAPFSATANPGADGPPANNPPKQKDTPAPGFNWGKQGMEEFTREMEKGPAEPVRDADGFYKD